MFNKLYEPVKKIKGIHRGFGLIILSQYGKYISVYFSYTNFALAPMTVHLLYHLHKITTAERFANSSKEREELFAMLLSTNSMFDSFVIFSSQIFFLSWMEFQQLH